MLGFILTILSSFFVVLATLPLLINSAWKHGILERDSNKLGKPFVPGLGGFALYGGITSGILFFVLYQVFLDKNASNLPVLLAGLACISILALIGIFDDVFKLSRVVKSVLPIAGAFPLIAVNAGKSVIDLPFLGSVDFGLFYTFILIPLGVTGSANAVNMSAGYNGLEAGVGAIACFFLIIIGIQTGAPTAGLIILFACLGACLAFLLFNRFPAKVFPGDIGTLSIGAAIASAVIISGLEKYGAVLFLPAFYELLATLYFGFKGVERRKSCHNPVITADGKLSPPKGSERFTLFYFILSKRKMTEEKLVAVVWSLYALCGVIALGLYYF